MAALIAGVNSQNDLGAARNLAVETIRASGFADRRTIDHMLRKILETQSKEELLEILQEVGERKEGEREKPRY
jgi:hypothetical protein